MNHIDDKGRVAMVDVGDKPIVSRKAVARAVIRLQNATLELIYAGGVAKGDVLATARIAAINAAKRTDELIPLCHQIPLNSVKIEFEPLEEGAGLAIIATVDADWKTGVEMEALLACSVAALTIYDMCKAVDENMCITDLKLVEKTKLAVRTAPQKG